MARTKKKQKKLTSLSDTKQLGLLRSAIEKALATVTAELGVAVEVGGIRYDSGGTFCSTKVTYSIASADGNTYNQFERAYIDNIEYMSDKLKVDDLGKSFKRDGEVWTICGLRPRSKKHPVLATDGVRTHKWALEYVEGARLTQTRIR